MEDNVVKMLMEMGCLRISPKSPFTYGSGLKGPIYCDNRYTLGFPLQRKEIVQRLIQKIKTEKLEFDTIGAVATAGIPYGSIVAHELNAPLVYVRATSKAYGMKKRVEGHYRFQEKILLIEDLVNQGVGLASAVLALREEGLIVQNALAIVDYEMLEAQEKLKTLEIKLFALTNFSSILSKASLSEEEKDGLIRWHQNPQHWAIEK